MNIEILKNAGIDYEGGVKRFMGREQLYMKTLSKFPKNDTMDRIRLDFAAQDRDALLRDVHEFKGMCGNMSMISLTRTADAIVTMLRSDGDGATDANLVAAMDALEQEYTTVKEAILAVAEVRA